MNTKPHVIITRLTLIISAVLYLASLTQECYCTTGNCGDGWTGGSILALGAIGGIMSVAGLTWYANPLLWMAGSLIGKRPKNALAFSAAALTIALSFLLFTQIADHQAGRMAYITEYRLGYWLWIASMAAMFVGNVIVFLLRRNETTIYDNAQLLRVDFNKRVKGGVKLISDGEVFKNANQKIKLYDGMQVIVWDEDYDEKIQDNLAVEAIVKYSIKYRCWVAEFDFDDLKHESEREKPLLDNYE